MFQSIGPIATQIQKTDKNNKVQFFSILEKLNEGPNSLIRGKIYWNELQKVYPDQIQKDKTVLLIPTEDLNYKVVVQDKEGIWKTLQGVILKVTDEFKDRFIDRSKGRKPTYLDTIVTAKKGTEPFGAGSEVDLEALFIGLRNESDRALQIESSFSELVLQSEKQNKEIALDHFFN